MADNSPQRRLLTAEQSRTVNAGAALLAVQDSTLGHGLTYNAQSRERKSDHISLLKGGRRLFTTGYADYHIGCWRGQMVGIKAPKRTEEQEWLTERVRNELTIWIRLKHENILPLFAYLDGTTGFTPFGGFLYPWSFYGDAEEFIDRHGHLMTTEDRIELWAGVVEGIHYLHSQSDPIIHGTIEPRKVIIDPEGNPRISNFSLSRPQSSSTHIPRYILCEIGSPKYLAPELLDEGEDEGEDEDDNDEVLVTLESDIWALGATALFFVFLQEPFAGIRAHHQFSTTCSAPALPPPDMSPSMEPLWKILSQCWESKPSSRPTSLQLLAHLEGRKEAGVLPLLQEVPMRLDAPCLSGSVKIPLNRPLFSGTYSNVYRGYYDDQLVAVKVLKVVGTLSTMRRKVRRERRVWATLDHPSILPLLGYADEEDMFQPLGALISPWCKFGDAGHFFGEHGETLSLQLKVRLWKGVIDGVAYLHSRDPSIIHGDLKPGNILIDDEGNPRLCDFGLSRMFASQDTACATTSSEHTGTPRYLSYELVRGDILHPDKGSDMFSVGCIGLEFLFLRQPYAHLRNNLRGEIFDEIRRFVPPSERPKNASSVLWTVVSDCWNPISGDRPKAAYLSSYLARLEPRQYEVLTDP